MYIGIDGNEANIKRRVGSNQYAFELLHGLYRLNNQQNNNKYVIFIKDAPLPDLPKENEYWKYRVLPGKGMWVLTTLQKYLIFNNQLDVFFTPTHYLPFITRCPKVCAIHDLGYLNFSGQFKKFDFWQLKYWTAISLYVSKYIITFSEFTKKDIVRHYPFARKKVKIVYHGYDNIKFTTKISEKHVRQITKKYRISKSYILFLSTLKPSKNIEGLLNSFKILKEEGRLSVNGIVNDYQLVIAGKKGWMFEKIFEKVKDLRLEKDVIFTDYVEEDDKPALFTGARLFILPSFWEGFGMDVLNSLACGTPVVVSNVASLPEVAGKAGIYIDPNDTGSIAEGIGKVLALNDVEYSRLVQVGLRQVVNFSWEKSARETLNVLTKV